MVLQYYVIESATGKHINIEVDAASKDDLEITRSGWQTVWDTDFILDPQKEKYVAKTEEGEIVALGAYRVREGSVAVYIAYIESQPESNPTLTRQKKYQGIGKAMIAFGIQLSIDANCNGVVVFEAKTDELEEHYPGFWRASGSISVSRWTQDFYDCRSGSQRYFFFVSFLRKEKDHMKEYNKDFDIDFSPMSDETMSWLDELLMTCKRFHVDYYNASEKDRAFVEAVARKNYGLKQARNSGKPASTVAPFFGIHRAG